jgi:hypothetical protein
MTQAVWPCVQLSVHVDEQPALGAAPEQTWGDVHFDVDPT